MRKLIPSLHEEEKEGCRFHILVGTTKGTGVTI